MAKRITDKTFGQVCYDGFCRMQESLELPDWEELGHEMRLNWECAANDAIAAAVMTMSPIGNKDNDEEKAD